jgi:hypothetical protein
MALHCQKHYTEEPILARKSVLLEDLDLKMERRALPNAT